MTESVAVVVVGDFGRSPRMQYHTLSLANHGYNVSVVASQGSPPMKEITSNPRITLHLIKDLQFESMPRFIRYALKIVTQTFLLLWNLLYVIPKPGAILVQNPPSVPVLPCVWISCRIRGSKYIVDWHNYGYSILAMNIHSETSFAVKFYQWMEFVFGSRADRGFCVSQAMKKDLMERFPEKSIRVLYDKPPTRFKPIDWSDSSSILHAHRLLVRLSGGAGMKVLSKNSSDTVLTRLVGNIAEPKARYERPFILLSSTSWTEDEDFGLLLSALKKYDKAAKEGSPNILCIVTGKGPQKEFYLEKISTLKLQKVTIVTPWLAIQDYPQVVALCDVGVSLHKSSSQLDLPMKIVDMFGCCVPVLAWKYNCISELVKPDETGLLFESSDQLCRHLLKVCAPNSAHTLALWRSNIELWQELRWERNWDNCALEVFQQD